MEAIDLIEALRRAGLTQTEIAERSGVPQPTISKVSRGEVRDVLSRNYRALQRLWQETQPPLKDGADPVQIDVAAAVADAGQRHAA